MSWKKNFLKSEKGARVYPKIEIQYRAALSLFWWGGFEYSVADIFNRLEWIIFGHNKIARGNVYRAQEYNCCYWPIRFFNIAILLLFLTEGGSLQGLDCKNFQKW